MYQPSRSFRATKIKAADASAEPRHVVIHDYHDHSMDSPHFEESDEEVDVDDHKKRSGPRGGVNVPFPTKLHVMLSKVETEGLTDIVSWQPHGRCFVIHKPREFVDHIMPEYFRQSKLTSFQRQLNLYGFRRLTTGADRGGYYHEMFLKHKLFLCRSMTRIRIKGTGIKGKASPETEPDFYAMPEIRPDHDVINQRIETEVLSAMEDEDSNVSTVSKRAKREAEEIESNEEPASSRQSKKNGVNGAFGCSLAASHPSSFEASSFQPSVLITPEAHFPKAQVSFSRKSSGSGSAFNSVGSNRRCIYPDSANSQQDLIDLAPPLHRSPSDHSLLSPIEYHSDDLISFEGQHFHYLDSFAVHGTDIISKVLSTSESASQAALSQSCYSSTISLPHLISNISQEDLSSTNFNPDTIFSRDDGDRGWAIDIDHEFLLMEK